MDLLIKIHEIIKKNFHAFQTVKLQAQQLQKQS